MRNRINFAFLLGCLVVATSVSADVVVLKSGRRIETWKVEERGDRVYYQTPEGEVGIPKRLVERIERSDSVPNWAAKDKSSVKLSTSDLPALGEEAVERVVAGGRIDRELLKHLEDEADHNLTEAPKARAAAAHALVADFYYEQGDLPAAENSLKRALTFAPNHPRLVLNLAVLAIEQQRYPAALDYIQTALRDPGYSFEAYRLQGWVYYRMEDLDRAASAWKQALAARPDAEVEALLRKAEREEQVAERYLDKQSGRFVLRYDSGQAPDRVGIEILAALDEMYSDMVGTFNYSPRQPIVVLLYPQDTFYDLTGVPPEVHGLYDGKVRVPISGLNTVPPQLRTVLRHELVHAFVALKTRGHAPRWLQEGLAQWHAGQRPPVPASAFRPLFEARDGSAVFRIQQAFGTPAQMGAAYMASWYVVDSLQRRYSLGDMDRLLEALARGESMDQALYSAFRLTYEDLDREVFDSLR